VYDGSEWLVFRNCLTIFLGAENCADPAKVDVLREYTNNLLDAYPDTIPQLEKNGVRVRALLNRRIETFEDVEAWANSIFNSGPISRYPAHVDHTVELAYDDIIIEVKSGREPVYVIPVAPRGSGLSETVDFVITGSKKRYGPRHEFTKLAFSKQVPKKGKKSRYRGQPVPEGEPQRPRGRPRLDGLVPGSPEAKKADRQKQKDREKRRKAREAKRGGDATITTLRPRRPLARIGRDRKEA
jgi:hypothetical protein